jgi:hypothetical protein
MKRMPFLFVFILIFGCAAGQTQVPPGQLATKVMETRNLNIPYDRAYVAATNAFFAIGYSIKHTDKASGIIVGSKSDPGTGKKVGLVLLFGIAGALVDTKTNYEITVMLTPTAPAITTIRIGEAVDGQPIVNKEITDKLWTVIEREAMVDEPVAKPKESEKSAKKTLTKKSPEGKPETKIKPTEAESKVPKGSEPE